MMKGFQTLQQPPSWPVQERVACTGPKWMVDMSKFGEGKNRSIEKSDLSYLFISQRYPIRLCGPLHIVVTMGPQNHLLIVLFQVEPSQLESQSQSHPLTQKLVLQFLPRNLWTTTWDQ